MSAEATVLFREAVARHNPEAASKAGAYSERFSRAFDVLRASRSPMVRERAFDDMLMLAARACKHANRLAMYLPNDLELELEYSTIRDRLESKCHRDLQEADRIANGKESRYILKNVQLFSDDGKHGYLPFNYNLEKTTSC